MQKVTRTGDFVMDNRVIFDYDRSAKILFVEDQWKLGNLRERRLADFFAQPLMKKFAARKAERPPECGACERLAFCHGGCLKDRLPDRASGTGRTHFCESYRELFAVTAGDVEQWAKEIRAQAPPASAKEKAEAPGRNEPCPCGSGKKYKKCCGIREERE